MARNRLKAHKNGMNNSRNHDSTWDAVDHNQPVERLGNRAERRAAARKKNK